MQANALNILVAILLQNPMADKKKDIRSSISIVRHMSLKHYLVTKTIVFLLVTGFIAPAYPADSDESESDVYILIDLDDCFQSLDRLLEPENIERMRNGREEDMNRYHHGFGTWLRNNWGLWGGSHLARWFSDRGIYHPDDMSGIILRSYWRYLNKQPIRLDEQIRQYQEYWKNLESKKSAA